MQNQMANGLKIRKDLLESQPNPEDSAPSNVLTQCVWNCPDFGNGDLSELDYCVYFTFMMVEALLNEEGNVLNKSNSYLSIY